MGEKNVINEPLVYSKSTILSSLHIKLNLMKQFAKALDKSDACFRYICNTFPGLRREKAKVGIFDGPQICKLIKDQAFVSRITALVFVSRGSYVSVV